MPAELQELLTRIKSFYTDETFMHVKDDYKPPYWAWNNVRWNELWHEVKALYVQQLPKVGKNQAIKDVVDFVKGLTPEDQRVLGVDNLGYSVGFASRAKWIRLVGTSVVGFSGMTGALSAVYDALISDARERENCAEKPSDEEFLTCLNDHINVKFAIHYLLRGKTVDDITDENGKITNPKVASEIRHAVDQRNSFLLKKIARDSNDEAIQEKARQTLFNGDSYRLELVMADDKDFKRMVLGDSKTPSYLQVRFPKVFSQNKETLKKILDLKFASKEQNHLIMELCDSSPTMAEEVKLLLDRRKNPNDPTSSFVLLDPKGICLEDLSEAAAASDSK
ncbi:unnamed protein product [Sphagnum jensenii]|uniref:Uncharacterized protein n=1 Tax=Sphagnum jensenii TaxID=128206 RepID=A0ABP0V6X6_9BRYO